MAEVGKYNNLKVLRKAEQGLYLAGERENDILLPNAYIPENCEIGDEIEVFVYRDSEDRIIATTIKPYATVGEFAGLKVVASTKIGAFLDWGLAKDLLVPFKEQQERMIKGKTYLVYILLDEETDRVIATSRFNRFLNHERPELTEGQEVDLLINKRTHLGWHAIVNNMYKGTLFENEIFQALHPGQKLKGYVKQVRPDDKIDLTLQKSGFANIDPVIQKIMEYLETHDGSMDITDKSPAELIYLKFGISKRAFKQAIGILYRKRMVKIESNHVSLLK
jgi:hypothetical protein